MSLWHMKEECWRVGSKSGEQKAEERLANVLKSYRHSKEASWTGSDLLLAEKNRFLGKSFHFHSSRCRPLNVTLLELLLLQWAKHAQFSNRKPKQNQIFFAKIYKIFIVHSSCNSIPAVKTEWTETFNLTLLRWKVGLESFLGLNC